MGIGYIIDPAGKMCGKIFDYSKSIAGFKVQ